MNVFLSQTEDYKKARLKKKGKGEKIKQATNEYNRKANKWNLL